VPILLTRQASAITAFTLAVLSVFGQGSWTTALQSVTGFVPGGAGYFSMVMWFGIIELGLAVGAMLLAGRVLTGDPDQARWEGHLARAAAMIALLGTVFAVVTIIGAVFSS
jgi:hypothetical protein